MTGLAGDAAVRPMHRWLFSAAALLLAVYAANIALRLAHIKFGADEWRLGDVGEFLVVLGCMVLFVAGLLALERSGPDQTNQKE
ncbi:MAG: hypothetical protein ABI533_08475 [Betaproteobacteria bacterium]